MHTYKISKVQVNNNTRYERELRKGSFRPWIGVTKGWPCVGRHPPQTGYVMASGFDFKSSAQDIVVFSVFSRH